MTDAIRMGVYCGVLRTMLGDNHLLLFGGGGMDSVAGKHFETSGCYERIARKHDAVMNNEVLSS